MTAGVVALALALLHHVLDHGDRAPSIATDATFAFGANAIAEYALLQITSQVVRWDLLLLPYRGTRTMLGEPIASPSPILLYMTLIWAAMDVLRRKGWIIRI